MDEARNFVELVGGADAVKTAIDRACDKGEFQWALQLVDRLIYAADGDAPESRKLKAAILRRHAEAQINCPTRHYYIQSAKELEA